MGYLHGDRNIDTPPHSNGQTANKSSKEKRLRTDNLQSYRRTENRQDAYTHLIYVYSQINKQTHSQPGRQDADTHICPDIRPDRQADILTTRQKGREEYSEKARQQTDRQEDTTNMVFKKKDTYAQVTREVNSYIV
jgi:hypothetical protein